MIKLHPYRLVKTYNTTTLVDVASQFFGFFFLSDRPPPYATEDFFPPKQIDDFI